MSTVAEPMTAEELLKMPRGQARYELIRGRLITMSPSGSEHGVVTMRVSSRVNQFVCSRNLGLVFGAETGFRLERNPDTVRSPDLAFVAQVNVPPGGIPRGYWPGPPGLAVEVISQTPHSPSSFGKMITARSSPVQRHEKPLSRGFGSKMGFGSASPNTIDH